MVCWKILKIRGGLIAHTVLKCLFLSSYSGQGMKNGLECFTFVVCCGDYISAPTTLKFCLKMYPIKTIHNSEYLILNKDL